jgi:hypothetical protein
VSAAAERSRVKPGGGVVAVRGATGVIDHVNYHAPGDQQRSAAGDEKEAYVSHGRSCCLFLRVGACQPPSIAQFSGGVV